MAKGRYRIKGTKDFLVAAVAAAVFCVWFICDGWFPAKRVLKKHPVEYTVSAPLSGRVKSVSVEAGDMINGEMAMVTLDESSFKRAADLASKEYEAAKGGDTSDLQKKLEVLKKAQEELRSCVIRNTDIVLETSHGEEPLRGKVLDVKVRRAMYVKEGDPLLLVKPKDTFYPFNRISAVITLIGTGVFLYFHYLASR